VVDHGRSEAASITGGYVYRGGITSLQGQYIYGDYITGRSWSLRYDGTTLTGPVERTSQLDPDGTGPLTMASQLASFGEDGFGEMYMVALGRSAIYRIAESVNEWNRTSGGTWHTTASWSQGTIPNSNTAIAHNLAGSTGGLLTLAADSGNASIVYENLNYRDHTISAPLALGSNLDVKLGTGRALALTGQLDWGGRSMNVQSGDV
jgi:hypothetical protein